MYLGRENAAVSLILLQLSRNMLFLVVLVATGSSVLSSPVDLNAAWQTKLPQPFQYGYAVNDVHPRDRTKIEHSRAEASDGQELKGQYRVLLPDGLVQLVSYTSGVDGYRAEVKYEGSSVVQPDSAWNQPTPSWNQPVTWSSWNQPVTQSPSWNQPVTHPPSWNQPVTHPPSWNQPVTHPPSWNQPATHPPSWNQPVTYPPSWNEPVTHQTIRKEPLVLDPVWNKPARHQLDRSDPEDSFQSPEHTLLRPFQFHYDVDEIDPKDRRKIEHSHSEVSDGSERKGQYQTRLADGRLQIVTYTAGVGGYKAEIKYEGTATEPIVTRHSSRTGGSKNNHFDHQFRPVSESSRFQDDQVGLADEFDLEPVPLPKARAFPKKMNQVRFSSARMRDVDEEEDEVESDRVVDFVPFKMRTHEEEPAVRRVGSRTEEVAVPLTRKVILEPDDEEVPIRREPDSKRGRKLSVPVFSKFVESDESEGKDEQVATMRPFRYQYQVDETHPKDRSKIEHSKSETSDGKEVRGEYFTRLDDGRIQIVKYTAGVGGFKADITYEGTATEAPKDAVRPIWRNSARKRPVQLDPDVPERVEMEEQSVRQVGDVPENLEEKSSRMEAPRLRESSRRVPERDPPTRIKTRRGERKMAAAFEEPPGEPGTVAKEMKSSRSKIAAMEPPMKDNRRMDVRDEPSQDAGDVDEPRIEDVPVREPARRTKMAAATESSRDDVETHRISSLPNFKEAKALRRSKSEVVKNQEVDDDAKKAIKASVADFGTLKPSGKMTWHKN